MKKKSVLDIDVKGKRVLMRVDFNVPLDNGKVADDSRIRAALPTIRHILDAGASLTLMSHQGRPKGKRNLEFSLKPAADRLAELLEQSVEFAPDCVGTDVEQRAQSLQPGQVLLLENLRFHPEEEGKPDLAKDASAEEKASAQAEMKRRQEGFAKQLAALGDLYVNDAFGTAHRAHASTAVVTRFYEERVAGLLMRKELEYLGKALETPERPFTAVLGGAKISGKIDVVMSLIEKVDTIIVGGGMVFTFYKAMGLPVGNSLVEEDKIGVARDTLEKIREKGVRFLLPKDHVVADAFRNDAAVKTVGEKEIEEGWMALDIGPESRRVFGEEIHRSKMVVWNGPMGCFEMASFAEGTMAMAQAIAETDCLSIVGGGDSVSAVNRSGRADRFTHISTGGGASLEFLEGKPLPGVEALSEL